jgi:ribonuclease HII
LKRRSSRAERLKELLYHERKLNSSGYRRIAGVDEAGRGPLAGPVVAGAVILKDFEFVERIDDSKRLSEKLREKAYKEIAERAIIGIGIVDEKTIDRINIYRATIKAMELAIADLKIPPDYVIVDGRVKLSTRCPIRCIIEGDSKSLSIAAASIIAKVTRDRLMIKYHQIYPQYGFIRHKGYGTRAHMAALRDNGPSPIHRFSFHPVKELAPERT